MDTSTRILIGGLAAALSLTATWPAAADSRWDDNRDRPGDRATHGDDHETRLSGPGIIAESFSSGQTLDVAAFVFNVSASQPVSFFDNFVFTVAAGQSLTVSETPLAFGSFPGATSNLSGITDTLYSGSASVFSQLGGVNPDTSGLTPLALSAVLGPGTYTLEVSGTDTGRGSFFNLSGGVGAFAQQLKFTSAVPEPSSTALMLAGAGLLLGAAGRRRKHA